jgi:hypothetical protein
MAERSYNSRSRAKLCEPRGCRPGTLRGGGAVPQPPLLFLGVGSVQASCSEPNARVQGGALVEEEHDEGRSALLVSRASAKLGTEAWEAP